MDPNGNHQNTEYIRTGEGNQEVQVLQQNMVLKEGRKYFSSLGLMFFSGTLIIYVVQLIAMLIVQMVNPQLMQSTSITLLISMAPMYIFAMPLMMFLISRVPAQKMKKDHKLSAGQMFLAFLMCYAVMYVSNLIGTVVTFLIGLVKGSSVDNGLVGIVTETNPLIIILLMVFCAPVFEELIFRKLLIDRAVKYGEGVAVLLSGLMFGLFHGNLSQFVYAFTLGLFFAFLYVKTGRIRYTIILHMMINFLGSVVSMIVMKASGYIEFMQVVTQMQQNSKDGMTAVVQMMPRMIILIVYGCLVLAAVIVGVVLLIVFHKKFKLEAGEITIPKGKRFLTVIVNVGMLLFIVFWLIMIISQLIM